MVQIFESKHMMIKKMILFNFSKSNQEKKDINQMLENLREESVNQQFQILLDRSRKQEC